MHCLGREYRVVCTQSPNQQVFVDIVPADNALHLLILQERQKRSGEVKEIAGSIKLYDMGEGNAPEILFLPPENGGLPEVELSGAEENRLRYLIKERFNEMMAQNATSTLEVRTEIHQKYVNGVIEDMITAVDNELAEKETKEAVKKFKVVCSQPKFSDDVYIDIAPDSGVIHDQIFFSRIQLHKQTSGQPLSRLFGSIYLYDDNGDISVEFPKPQSRKDSPIYQGVMRQYSFLEPQIVDTYRKMLQAGMESTLFVYGVNEMFEMSAEKNAEAEAFERRRREKMRQIAEQTEGSASYKQKHAAQISPQTPQEEFRLMQNQRFKAVRERRIAGEQKRATETVPAWLRFQKQYSGD